MSSDVQQQQQRQRAALDDDIIDCTSPAEDDITSRSEVLQHRHWVQVTRSDNSVNSMLHSTDSHKLITTSDQSLHDSTVRFRLATYNILSDNAIERGEYLYCPSQLRYMSSRHERIIAEIHNMQPHVICFQVSSLLSLFLSLSVSLSVSLRVRLIHINQRSVQVVCSSVVHFNSSTFL